MKALVTGGAGFIGSNIAMELDKEHEVTVLDNFSNATEKNLEGFKGDKIKGSISGFKWQKLDVDVVFHEAAISDTRVMDENLMMQTNVEAFRKMLEWASQNKVKVIYASSAAVYGNSPAPHRVSQPLTPLNIYGKSKVEMDKVATEYFNKMHVIGLRYFNVFGPREAHKDKFASMIYQLAQQMKSGKKPRIFTDGEQKRDHIYVKDVLQANFKAINAKKSGIANVGIGKPTTYNEIVRILNDVLDTNLETEYFECPYDFFQKHTEADLTEAKELFDYTPEWSVEAGVKDYYKSGWL